jgi:hypothetical protein
MNHTRPKRQVGPTVRLGRVVLAGRRIELGSRKPGTPEDEAPIMPERVPNAPANAPASGAPSENGQTDSKRRETANGLPVTIRVGPKCRVPGFRPGDRVRIVGNPEPNCPCPQLTPADLQAIANILRRRGVGCPDFSGDLSPDERGAVAEAEGVWTGILAALDRFPGSEVIQ